MNLRYLSGLIISVPWPIQALPSGEKALGTGQDRQAMRAREEEGETGEAPEQVLRIRQPVAECLIPSQWKEKSMCPHHERGTPSLVGQDKAPKEAHAAPRPSVRSSS